MKRRRIRVLFVAVLVALPLQYGLVGLLQVLGAVEREPWPVVVFPGFKDVWDREEAVAVPEARVFARFADGGSMPVPPARLLAPLPASHLPAFFRAQCRPSRAGASASADPAARCTRPEAAAWFARRLGALFPGRTPVRLDVVWGEVVLARGARRVTRTPRDTLSIALPNAPTSSLRP